MFKEFKWIFIYLLRWIRHKGGGVHWCMYMYGNTESAFTTELLDGYLPNLVGIKYSWPPHICIDFWAKSAQGRIQGRAIIGQWGALLQMTSLESEGYSNKQCIAMIKKHLGRSVVIFGSILMSSFWHGLVLCIGLNYFDWFFFKYF